MLSAAAAAALCYYLLTYFSDSGNLIYMRISRRIHVHSQIERIHCFIPIQHVLHEEMYDAVHCTVQARLHMDFFHIH